VTVRAMTSDELARSHAARLPRYQGRIRPITDVRMLSQLVDRHTMRQFEERVARGVYVIGTPSAPGAPQQAWSY
jgi:hypothetical protein